MESELSQDYLDSHKPKESAIFHQFHERGLMVENWCLLRLSEQNYLQHLQAAFWHMLPSCAILDSSKPAKSSLKVIANVESNQIRQVTP